MSTVAQDVQQIREAIYGRDVREAIADGIEHCYSDVSGGVTTANAAAVVANAAAQRANTAAAGAEGIPGTASLEDVNNLKSVINTNRIAITPSYQDNADLDPNTGEIVPLNGYRTSELLDISSKNLYVLENNATSDIYIWICYYDANGRYIEREQFRTTDNAYISRTSGYLRYETTITNWNKVTLYGKTPFLPYRDFNYENFKDSQKIIQTIDDISDKSIQITTYRNLKSFNSNSGNTVIDITLNLSAVSDGSYISVFYNDGSRNRSTSSTFALTTGSKQYTLEVDCASLIQYQNAEYFFVVIAGTVTGRITRYSVSEKDNLSSYPYYDGDFRTMMRKTFSAIEQAEHGEVTLNLRNPSGEKYGLLVTSENEIGLYKVVPSNMLIMGNSLVFGFSHGDESFGMAATSGENDFAYHLIKSIKSFNPIITVDKLYSSPFEHAETLSDAQSFLTSNTNYWNASRDLVVIEMGDNVNTEAKRTVFAQSFPLLLNKIRMQCPKARVVCVGIWFNNGTVYNIMMENALKYGCEFVDIRGIRNSETEGEVGATVYFKDGATTTVTEARATHPGNLGMERIANAIIEKLNI